MRAMFHNFKMNYTRGLNIIKACVHILMTILRCIFFVLHAKFNSHII